MYNRSPHEKIERNTKKRGGLEVSERKREETWDFVEQCVCVLMMMKESKRTSSSESRGSKSGLLHCTTASMFEHIQDGKAAVNRRLDHRSRSRTPSLYVQFNWKTVHRRLPYDSLNNTCCTFCPVLLYSSRTQHPDA